MDKLQSLQGFRLVFHISSLLALNDTTPLSFTFKKGMNIVKYYIYIRYGNGHSKCPYSPISAKDAKTAWEKAVKKYFPIE